MFRITGLPAEAFAPLFALDDRALAERCAVRCVASGGEPCRVSLTDAAPGDDLVLVNHEHLPTATPFRGRYAVYVRPGERQATFVDAVPEQLARRTLAARSFDAAGMNVDARLVAGTALAPVLGELLADPAAAYVHLHFAAAGCYAARADRA
jgi:hypothetical protein